MATSTLTAAMPALELTQGEVLKLEAIDSTTGLAVAGVVVNNMVIYATESRNDDPGELTLENVYLTPRAGEVIDPGNFGGPAG